LTSRTISIKDIELSISCLNSPANLTVSKNKTASANITISDSFVFAKAPESYLFDRGINSQISKDCHLRFWKATSDTKPNFCRIGQDKTSPPLYFVYGDSMGLALSPAFEELSFSGMFAGLDGGYCHPLLSTDKSYPQIGYKGFLKFILLT
jgi:hypothetical protein